MTSRRGLRDGAQLTSHHRIDHFTVGAPLDLRHNRLHHVSHIFFTRGAGGANRLGDQRRNVVLIELLGLVVAIGFELERLFGNEIIPTAFGELLDCFLALFDGAGQSR